MLIQQFLQTSVPRPTSMRSLRSLRGVASSRLSRVHVAREYLAGAEGQVVPQVV